jgi:hypothetical protein
VSERRSVVSASEEQKGAHTLRARAEESRARVEESRVRVKESRARAEDNIAL